jgi:hypothetical protein
VSSCSAACDHVLKDETSTGLRGSGGTRFWKPHPPDRPSSSIFGMIRVDELPVGRASVQELHQAPRWECVGRHAEHDSRARSAPRGQPV